MMTQTPPGMCAHILTPRENGTPVEFFLPRWAIPTGGEPDQQLRRVTGVDTILEWFTSSAHAVLVGDDAPADSLGITGDRYIRFLQSGDRQVTLWTKRTTIDPNSGTRWRQEHVWPAPGSVPSDDAVAGVLLGFNSDTDTLSITVTLADETTIVHSVMLDDASPPITHVERDEFDSATGKDSDRIYGDGATPDVNHALGYLRHGVNTTVRMRMARLGAASLNLVGWAQSPEVSVGGSSIPIAPPGAIALRDSGDQIQFVVDRSNETWHTSGTIANALILTANNIHDDEGASNLDLNEFTDDGIYRTYHNAGVSPLNFNIGDDFDFQFRLGGTQTHVVLHDGSYVVKLSDVHDLDELEGDLRAEIARVEDSATGLTSVSVTAPLEGTGTAADPLDIDIRTSDLPAAVTTRLIPAAGAPVVGEPLIFKGPLDYEFDKVGLDGLADEVTAMLVTKEVLHPRADAVGGSISLGRRLADADNLRTLHVYGVVLDLQLHTAMDVGVMRANALAPIQNWLLQPTPSNLCGRC